MEKRRILFGICGDQMSLVQYAKILSEDINRFCVLFYLKQNLKLEV